MVRVIVALAAVLLPGMTEADTADDVFVARRWLMGTELRLVIMGDGARATQIAERCFALVAGTEASLSTWIDGSPLSRLNAHAGRQMRISPDMAAYLERCIEDHRRTRGAFDPSVGSWRELEAGTRPVTIGMDRIEIERTAGAIWVRFPSAGFALDSGGNGKGIAVDRVVRELRSSGVEAALVDFGGSSWYGLGKPPDAEFWTVTLPALREGAPHSIPLRDRALSVSATFLEDLHEIDASSSGTMRAHIFDPRTGEAVLVPRLAAITSPSAEDAEVLSTALVVEGEAGLGFLELYRGAEALVFEAAPESRDEH